jgi:hypothetical protein
MKDGAVLFCFYELRINSFTAAMEERKDFLSLL